MTTHTTPRAVATNPPCARQKKADVRARVRNNNNNNNNNNKEGRGLAYRGHGSSMSELGKYSRLFELENAQYLRRGENEG